MKRIFSILVMMMIGAARVPAWASTDVIHAIDVAGNIRTPRETITNTIISRVGQPISRDLVRRDITLLYQLGQFRDVVVEQVVQSDGLHLVYRVEEYPLIGSVGFSGNRKIKKNDLQSASVVKIYRPLQESDVAESIAKIRKLYSDKGYYLAEIDYHLEPGAEGETKLIFDITEHEGVIVRRVVFRGNHVFSDDELRDVIHTKQKGPFSFVTGSGKHDEEQVKRDKLLLTYFYLNHGYLKVRVSPAKTTLSKDKRYLFVAFQVHEGKQYRIGSVDMSGDMLTTREELLSILKTKSGKIYSQERLEGDIQSLGDRYGDEGYAFANIVPDTTPNDETLTADMIFRIEKGKRITIERINIFGNTRTRDKVIRRELKIVENDRYSERALRESRARLMKLGFFEEVNFATPRGSRDDAVILNITVKERQTGSFNIGAGFSTFDSFIFTASISKEDFLGYGISGSLSAEVSKRRQFFSYSMQDPYFLDTRWHAGFSVYHNAFLFNDFRRTALGGTLSLGHPIFDNWSVDTGYQLEDVSISSFSAVVPQAFRANAGGLTSALSLSLARDTRDNRLVPSKGMYHIVTGEISGKELGGDNNFFRINERSMYYQSIWGGIIFKTFGRIGYIKSLNNSAVPLFERFFGGGPFSLRGFFPNSVGPRLRIPTGPAGRDADFTYGGDKLLLFVGELELPIYNPAGIKAVAFYDAGNAFAEEENYSFAKLRSDYGFGLRWNSPMGPLRFEWGIPIDQRPGEDSVVFNFTIGNFF